MNVIYSEIIQTFQYTKTSFPSRRILSSRYSKHKPFNLLVMRWSISSVKEDWILWTLKSLRRLPNILYNHLEGSRNRARFQEFVRPCAKRGLQKKFFKAASNNTNIVRYRIGGTKGEKFVQTQQRAIIRKLFPRRSPKQRIPERFRDNSKTSLASCRYTDRGSFTTWLRECSWGYEFNGKEFSILRLPRWYSLLLPRPGFERYSPITRPSAMYLRWFISSGGWFRLRWATQERKYLGRYGRVWIDEGFSANISRPNLIAF